MKRIIRRVQSLGQKAAELKEAMEKLPPKVAEIRQAYQMTTGQLQQLREDVQSSVAELKAVNSDGLDQALQQINGSTEVFRQAGYELSGVDMELSGHQRLVVHLNRLADVRASTLRALIEANHERKTTQALLRALLKAGEVAQQMQLSQLSYRSLMVQVGPVPSVRICWRADEVFEEELEGATGERAQPPPMPSSHQDSLLGKGSFFGNRKEPSPRPPAAAPTVESGSTPVPPESTVATSDSVETTPVENSSTSRSAAWHKDSLERFKTNPHFSKYHR